MISDHFGHCAGQNLRCFQRTSLHGVFSPTDTENENFVNKMLNLNGVAGAGVIVGIGIASSSRRIELKQVMRPSLLAIAVAYFVSLPFDAAMAFFRPGPPHSTTSHLWYLHSVTCAVLCVYIIDSGRVRSWARLAAMGAVIAAIELVALPVYAQLDHARVASLETHELGKECFSTSWMVAQKGWEPVGIRVLTGVPGILLGYMLSPVAMAWTWRARSRLRVRALCLAFLAWQLYHGVFFGPGGVDLRDPSKAEAIQVRGQFAPAEPPFSSASKYLAAAGLEVLSMGRMVANVVAQLIVAPAGRLPVLTWLGENPQLPYMFHPHVLWLLEPMVFGALRRVFEARIDVHVVLIAVPFFYQAICALPLLLLDSHGAAATDSSETLPARAKLMRRAKLLYRQLREWGPVREVLEDASLAYSLAKKVEWGRAWSLVAGGQGGSLRSWDAVPATIRARRWLRRPGVPQSFGIALLLVALVFAAHFPFRNRELL